MCKIGDIVNIIDDKSVFNSLLGSYGIIKEKAYADKWVIEFKSAVKGNGSFSHTARESDFKVVGSSMEANND